MDCLPGGITNSWSGRLQAPKEHRLVSRTVCCSTFPSEAVVFTASRLNVSTLRIIGPGSNFVTGGLGGLLAVDEFFVHPSHQQEETLGIDQAESLTYFLEVNKHNDTTNMGESQAVKHGIRALFRTCKKDVPDQLTKRKSLKLSPLRSHVKDAGSVETLFFDSGEGKGGAEVRIVAGQYRSVLTSAQENFVLLDTVMRPGSVAEIPAHPSHGLVVYILEGVGIINRHPSRHRFYENEGHGIWFPPEPENEVLGSSLHITCHMWSSLRALVLGVLVS